MSVFGARSVVRSYALLEQSVVRSYALLDDAVSSPLAS
jgi:hypothetical protein